MFNLKLKKTWILQYYILKIYKINSYIVRLKYVIYVSSRSG